MPKIVFDAEKTVVETALRRGPHVDLAEADSRFPHGYDLRGEFLADHHGRPGFATRTRIILLWRADQPLDFNALLLGRISEFLQVSGDKIGIYQQYPATRARNEPSDKENGLLALIFESAHVIKIFPCLKGAIFAKSILALSLNLLEAHNRRRRCDGLLRSWRTPN